MKLNKIKNESLDIKNNKKEIQVESYKEPRQNKNVYECKDRKELTSKIKEARKNNQKYKIQNSLVEGYRYTFRILEDNNPPQTIQQQSTQVQPQQPANNQVVANNQPKQDRYKIQRYGNYYYGIIDQQLNNGQGLYLRKGDKIDYNKPLNKDNDLLLFKNKEEAEQYKSTLKEDKEEEITPEEKPLPDVQLEEPPVVVMSEPKEDKNLENGIYLSINNNLTNKFDEIENIKAIINTIDEIGLERNRDEIINVLNQIIDESSTHIGMYQRLLELIDPRTNSIIEQGKDKAEEIMAGSQSPKEEDEPKEETAENKDK